MQVEYFGVVLVYLDFLGNYFLEVKRLENLGNSKQKKVLFVPPKNSKGKVLAKKSGRGLLLGLKYIYVFLQ